MHLKLNQTLQRPTFLRGIIKSETDDYIGAIDDFSKYIELEPYDANAYYHRGINRFQLNNYFFALDDVSKAIEINPDFADAYYKRGIILKEIGGEDEAEIDFKKYEDLKNNN